MNVWAGGLPWIFSTFGDNIFRQRKVKMSQVIKCKRSEVVEVDIAKAIRIKCSTGFAIRNGLFSLLGKKLGYQKKKVGNFALCFPEKLGGMDSSIGKLLIGCLCYVSIGGYGFRVKSIRVPFYHRPGSV